MKEVFQKRLRALRERAYPKRSATVTSQLMGFGKNTLGKYERGEREPTMSALAIMSDYYHVSVDYLMGRTNY